MNIQFMEGMLSQGVDTALLRFGLGKHYLDVSDAARSVEHLRRCVELEPGYSAAWKLLGKALLAAQDREAARSAWAAGILAAKKNGDHQAEKEMGVFVRRLNKT